MLRLGLCISNIFLVLLHPQLKLGLDIKPHRVAHGHIVEAISLLPGLNPQLKISLASEQLCVPDGHLVASSLSKVGIQAGSCLLKVDTTTHILVYLIARVGLIKQLQFQ